MTTRLRQAALLACMGALMIPTTASAASPAAGNTIVAKVGGQPIYMSEVLREAQDMGNAAQRVPPQILYPQIVQRLAITRLAAAKGYADKLQNTPEAKARLKDAEEQIVADLYVHKSVQPKITDDKIKARYDAMVAKFKPEDEVRARHILVPTEAEANDVIKALQGGADFAKLAAEKSKDSGSAKEGGELGFFPRTAMVKPFADAAFAMKANEVSDKPVKTDFGYHVIQVEERRKSAPPPLEAVHNQIANQLGQELAAQLVKSLESKTKIEMFNPDGTPMKKDKAEDEKSQEAPAAPEPAATK